MEMAKKEFLVQEDNVVLKDFVAANTAPLDSLVKDGMKARRRRTGSAGGVLRGEPQDHAALRVLPTFVRFVKAYKKAQQENERKKKAELDGVDGVSVGTPSPRKPGSAKSPGTPKMPPVDFLAELKKRQVKPQVQEGKDGTLEHIITDLRSTPYRRTDGWRPAQQQDP
ncbi:hypothetical protein CRUP_011094 [Coryphaenoides rupestris]|nr:hypothetical protein CRUP_011094 [Coryphaenoides rupestris]